MEQKKTIFSYIGQVFATYGIIVTIFIVFSILIGERACGVSSLFSLADEGLAINTLLQLLLMTVIINLSQNLFLTDRWIKNMPMIIRNILFFATVCVVIVVFAFLFEWFPVKDYNAWIGFAVSFVICTIISVGISKLEENAQNKKMEQALEKIKRTDNAN